MKTSRVVEVTSLLVIGALIVGILVGVYFVTAGISARPQPSAVERLVARTVRGAAISLRTRGLTNPIPATADTVAEGRDHFADHCAVCHGNDGSGNTEMGRGLYPKAPNMRLAAAMLHLGLREPVLEYLNMCKSFWRIGSATLDRWAAQIQAGEEVNFGAHLLY